MDHPREIDPFEITNIDGTSKSGQVTHFTLMDRLPVMGDPGVIIPQTDQSVLNGD